MDPVRQHIRSLLIQEDVDGLPSQTYFKGVPNYPIHYIDTDDGWVTRYANGEGIVEVNTKWAQRLLHMKAQRHGASAWEAAMAHEAAHGWWEDAVATSPDDPAWKEKMDQLETITPTGNLGLRYDLGPIHINTPAEEEPHERAVETLAAFYLSPGRLSEDERSWALLILQMLS